MKKYIVGLVNYAQLFIKEIGKNVSSVVFKTMRKTDARSTNFTYGRTRSSYSMSSMHMSLNTNVKPLAEDEEIQTELFIHTKTVIGHKRSWLVGKLAYVFWDVEKLRITQNL